MKTVYYDFLDNYFVEDEYKGYPEDGLSMFVEKNWKKTSCPFSKIKLINFSLSNAFKNTFEAFSHAQSGYLNNFIDKDELNNITRSTIHSARACPALNSVIKNSLMIKSPVDMVISWKGQEVISTPACGTLNIEAVNDHHSSQSTTEDGYKLYGETTTLKFKIPLRFKTSVPMISLQPSLHGPVPWTVVNGVFDAGRTFPVWPIVTVPSSEQETKTLHIKKDTVLAYLWSPEKYNLKYKTIKIGRFSDRKFSGN